MNNCSVFKDQRQKKICRNLFYQRAEQHQEKLRQNHESEKQFFPEFFPPFVEHPKGARLSATMYSIQGASLGNVEMVSCDNS